MSITTEALLLAKYNEYKPTAAEITAWNTVTKHASAVATLVTKAGLFGADLTKFNEECAELDWCKVEDYEDYSGWAVGVAWTPTSANTVATPLGVAFNGLKTLVQVTLSANAAVVNWKALTADATAAAPVSLTGFTAATDAFDGWSFKAVSGLVTEQTAFWFQEDGADLYLEADDTDDLWATGDSTGSSVTNVGSADFVFKGAASLVAASASIIVASLLF